MDILEKLHVFYQNFCGEKGVIGKSQRQKPIYYFAVNKSVFPKIICQYAIHAREYVTAYLALRQIEHFSVFGKVGTVYFIPVMNPDGVDIALKEKPLYKANARQVDLNVNFDAKWGEGIKNVRERTDENYVGPYPFSESETRALRDFTIDVMPDLTLSYHSKGEEIYWEFYQTGKDREYHFELANLIAKCTGYSVKLTVGSCGGYKDWCIEKFNIPSFTIEVGSDSLEHPLKEEHSDKIFEENREVLNILTSELWERNGRKIHASCDKRGEKSSRN